MTTATATATATMTDAISKLITDNLGLVRHFAKGYVGRGVEWEDLIGEGTLGLIDAAKTFRAEVGKFSTFAGHHIKRYLSLACRNRHDVSIPEYIFRYFPTIERVKLILGADASDAAIVAYCRKLHPMRKVNPVDALAAMRAVNCGSLNLPIGDDTRDRIANLADTRSTVDNVDIGEYLDVLDDRQRQVVTLRYGLETGEPMTLVECGKRLNVSHELVRQIEAAAMEAMRAA